MTVAGTIACMQPKGKSASAKAQPAVVPILDINPDVLKRLAKLLGEAHAAGSFTGSQVTWKVPALGTLDTAFACDNDVARWWTSLPVERQELVASLLAAFLGSYERARANIARGEVVWSSDGGLRTVPRKRPVSWR